MKIVVGSDHGGFQFKEAIKNHLLNKGYEVIDVGTSNESRCNYPDYAIAAGEKVVNGEAKYGFIVCTTGIGISIAANKVKGIRCAQVYDLFTAEMAKAHNNANFIAFGGRVNYSVPVKDMIEKFMTTNFAGGRHERRVARIMDIEKND